MVLIATNTPIPTIEIFKGQYAILVLVLIGQTIHSEMLRKKSVFPLWVSALVQKY